MKLIIAGSRTITDYKILKRALISIATNLVEEVVSGGCRGVDKLGERWAEENDIPVTRFLAKWYRYGKSAGPRRNEEMAKYADELLAIWDGKSSGTRSMIHFASKYHLRIQVHGV